MKAKKQKTTVGGILVSKVNDTILTEKLLELGLTESVLKGKPADFKLEAYTDWAKNRLDELKKEGGEYGECEECGAMCEVTWDHCPVCGTGTSDDDTPMILPVGADRAEIAKDLDIAVNRIKNYASESMRSIWHLGKELSDVFTSKLYKTRLGEGDKPLYKSWDHFVEAEIGLSGARARAYMVASTKFTEPQVVKLGVEKLRTIARAPESEHPALIAKAETMTTRELAAEVSANAVVQPQALPHGETSIGEKIRSGLGLGTQAAKEARDRKAKVEAGTSVTAVFQLGDFDIPLQKEGAVLVASQTLVNGIVCKYEIHNTGSKRFMRVKLSRPGEETVEDPVLDADDDTEVSEEAAE